MESGRLGRRMPVWGLTIGMGLRARAAEGWCSLVCGVVDWCGGEKWENGLGAAGSEGVGAAGWLGRACRCNGDVSGELLDRDDRSEDDGDDM